MKTVIGAFCYIAGYICFWFGGYYTGLEKRDYQLEVTQQGTTVFDGDRKVGFLPAGNTQLDSLIIYDNQ